MSIKLNLIAAACENMGIGLNGALPWRLRSEMEYFNRMTSETEDKSKKNVVIMGRRTWDSLPQKSKPLHGRINFIITRSNIDVSLYVNTYTFPNWDEINNKLNELQFKNSYETTWVIGGANVYEEAMKSKYFYRLYLTNIQKSFDCDTFFPKIVDNLKLIRDPRVPKEVQEEKGIKFTYDVYETTLVSS